MANSPFPWKRGFLKPSSAINDALGKISSRLVQVAATKRIPRSEIASGIYKHVGLRLAADGELEVTTKNTPLSEAGKWSTRNNFGWEITRKDLPMVSKAFSFEAPNFGDAARNGTSMRVVHRDVYQRKIFEPRGLMIVSEVMAETPGSVLVKFSVNETMDRDYHDFDRLLLWSLNILQENTGVTGVYAADASREDFLGSIALSWDVFPPGSVEEVVSRLSAKPPVQGNAADFKAHVRDRVTLFEKLKPVAYLRGQGGFGSYFGAQFADDFVVFENLRYGNAIYVLYENWEDVSKRSRLDLLRDSDAHFDRIPHVADWQDRLIALIRSELRRRRRRPLL